jgi:stearoyl-CoA desaturase (delta-9 desaturase)
LHAAVLTVVPLAGAGAAAVMARRDGVGAVEVSLLVGMYALTMVGLSVGFHRGLAHRAFDARPWVRAVLGVLGSLAAQGPVLYWVANHRRHHELADRPGDLHSPYTDGQQPLARLRGLWHAHVGWNFDHQVTNVLFYARDLLRDPVIARVSQRYHVIVLAGLLAPAAVGAAALGGWRGALAGLLWGGLLRIFLAYHATASINSITHWLGRRAYPTRDRSGNVWWLALPTFGESWHNNHHAFPASPWFGHRRREIDLGALCIAGLERLGLVRLRVDPARPGAPDGVP